MLGCSLVGLCVFSWRRYRGLGGGGGGGDPQLRDLLITELPLPRPQKRLRPFGKTNFLITLEGGLLTLREREGGQGELV